MIGIFLFGAACSQLTTDIAKYTIGRLRPHFFDICRPNIDCSLMENKHRYHESFICTNPHSDAYKLKEVRLSFLSGHSSFSAYTMVFLVVCCVLKVSRRFIGVIAWPTSAGGEQMRNFLVCLRLHPKLLLFLNLKFNVRFFYHFK
jgi:PAP2 superfamily